MINIFIMMKRKPGITIAEFQDHYENVHVAIARKHTGHLFMDYRRNYIRPDDSFATLAEGQKAGLGYDAIAHVTLADEDDFLRLQAIVSRPEVQAEFIADEELFQDRSMLAYFVCDEVKTWVGADLKDRK